MDRLLRFDRCLILGFIGGANGFNVYTAPRNYFVQCELGLFH